MLLGVLQPLCEEMMSFTSYLQNWLIDTSESQTCYFFSYYSYIYYIGQMFCSRDRTGGYTRLLRTRIRVGDAAPMAYIE